MRPAQKAAKWLLFALTDLEPGRRTVNQMAKASEGRFDRQLIAQGLSSLERRGFAEKDHAAWKRLHLASPPWALTPAGQLHVEDLTLARIERRPRPPASE